MILFKKNIKYIFIVIAILLVVLLVAILSKATEVRMYKMTSTTLNAREVLDKHFQFKNEKKKKKRSKLVKE